MRLALRAFWLLSIVAAASAQFTSISNPLYGFPDVSTLRESRTVTLDCDIDGLQDIFYISITASTGTIQWSSWVNAGFGQFGLAFTGSPNTGYGTPGSASNQNLAAAVFHCDQNSLPDVVVAFNYQGGSMLYILRNSGDCKFATADYISLTGGNPVQLWPGNWGPETWQHLYAYNKNYKIFVRSVGTCSSNGWYYTTPGQANTYFPSFASWTLAGTVSDLNMDGLDDLIIVPEGTGPFVYYQRNTTDAPRSQYKVDLPWPFAFDYGGGNGAGGDCDGDNDVDVAIINYYGLVILRNNLDRVNKNSTWDVVTTSNSTVGPYQGYQGMVPWIYWVDYNLDGKLDLSFVTGISPPGSPASKITLYRNAGNCSFTRVLGFDTLVSPVWQAYLSTPGSLTWLDYDGDGDKDAFVTGLTSSTTVVNQMLRNNQISASTAAAASSTYSYGLQVADMNLDGKMDIITSTKDTGVEMMVQQADGSFSRSVIR